MIITKTPLRISFAGGGSDIETYYKQFGGSVLSTTINKYIYISLNPSFDNTYTLKYSNIQKAQKIEELQHTITKAILKDYNINSGIELTSSADIIGESGLASSSAFTVGLINLCSTFAKEFLNKADIASKACNIEINELKEPIGKQDQYACSFGGLNFISFLQNGYVNVEPINLEKKIYQNLQKNLLLFYTGQTRLAKDILQEQNKNILSDKNKLKNLHKMVKLSQTLKNELLAGNIDSMGEILHSNWIYKKELANKISNENIDNYYNTALQNGALGGKILGAGSGGFLLFYVKEENQLKLKKALKDLKEVPFLFETSGTTVIYNNNHKD